MTKITFKWLLFLMMITSFTFIANAEVCNQTFTATGQDDGPTTVSVVATDITCNGANSINSLTLVNTASDLISGFCGTQYDFDLVIDGVTIVSHGCGTDLNGINIPTTFATLEVFSYDLDATSDGITITFDIAVDFSACNQPSDLTALNVTATTADLNWTELGTATTWNIEWGAQGFTPTGTPTNDDVTANPFSVTSLTAQTAYDFYVRADCGATDGLSAWAGPFTFTTTCGIYTPYYTQDFSTWVPNCWLKGKGPVTGATSYGASNWAQDGFANVGTSGAVRAYFNNATDNEWLETPSFDLSAGGYEINVDMALTARGSTAASAMGSDDELQLLYTEDGTTWTNITTWTAANAPSNTGDNVTINVSTITGANVKFGFWQSEGAVDDPEAAEFFLDNFAIQTIPTCFAPTNLSASNITEAQADIAWTPSGTETLWDIEWGAQGFTPTETPTNNDVTATTFTISGLTAGTAYEFYVRADCGAGDESAWAGPYNFIYPIGDNCSNAQDLSTESSPYSGTTTGYTASDITGMTCTGNGPSRIFFIDVPNGYQLHIGQVSNAFDSKHAVAYGATCPGDQEIVCTDDPDLQEVIWTNTTGSSQRVYYILSGYGSLSVGDFILEWSLVTCPEPTNLAVSNNLTDVSAELTWTTGGATTWDVEWGAQGFTPTGTPTNDNLTATTLSISGLTTETAYDFYVRDDCGADNITDVSIWVGPFTITTLAVCAVPTDLTATTTGVTAQLSWNGWTATNWDIEWGAQGFAPTGTPTIDDTPNFYDLSGLTAQTAYDFYVRADCGSNNIDTTVWVGPFTFTTTCGIYTPYYIEYFSTWFPNCWEKARGPVTGPETYGQCNWIKV
ncbi:MAG: fibronectin type III domain-containing protein [Salinivirgaceae bacterium]|nr:fibronectin type III domain-containing protein [Salinivirgaceae bacterium]